MPQRPRRPPAPAPRSRRRRGPAVLALACLLGALSAWQAPAMAQSAEAKGLEIANEAYDRDRGWGDTQVGLTMLLKNKQGGESNRELRIRGLETPGDGAKSLVIFDNPRDVAGTALLTYSHKVAEDDQWLYLPALKRVKRIASSNKSGPFVGSEFSYEDMVPQEVEKFTYKFIAEEACGSLQCFVVERYPVDKNSGYKRQVVYLDKAEYRVQKIDFYDRKDSHLKTLVNSEFKQYLGKHWRPLKSLMENLVSGKSTLLTYKDFEFKTGLSDNDFNTNRLQNVR